MCFYIPFLSQVVCLSSQLKFAFIRMDQSQVSYNEKLVIEKFVFSVGKHTKVD